MPGETIPLTSMPGRNGDEQRLLIDSDDHSEGTLHSRRSTSDSGPTGSQPRPGARQFEDLSKQRAAHLAPRRIGPDTPFARNYAFPTNAISNARYNALTFLPIILYEQFKFFFNLYFLIVALSQAWPPLRIGYLSSYIVPLAFVLAVTISKELYDDWLRRRRDRESNFEEYELTSGKRVHAQDLKVGQMIRLHTNQRVPADIVVIKSSEANGETFIRTDQLDGETDWKLRIACPLTQNIPLLASNDFELEAQAPDKHINQFLGTFELLDSGQSVPLSVDNTMWANTVVAAGTVEGLVVYTGMDTRMALNTTHSRNKVGLLELEVNRISKLLCAVVFCLSFVLVALEGFKGDWYVNVMRFLILFSTIIPVSLRVNLDMAKTVFGYQIEHDASIPGTIVRTSTIPEDLGRICYLLTDKTGTITQNDMDLRRIHVGAMSFYGESMEDVAGIVRGWNPKTNTVESISMATRGKRDLAQKVMDLVLCLAVCHSVTPTEDGGFQAVSPDEIALVSWVADMGLELVKRDRKSLTLLHKASNSYMTWSLLYVFPFSSDTKRMGVVARNIESEELFFFEKGADTVMIPIVKKSDWLEEEVNNMAREGLRTLVIGKKKLSQDEYDFFTKGYEEASLSMQNRDQKLAEVVAGQLECNLTLLGVTGVEDKLQDDVKPSLELLRNAGVKIWMLTGDKVETAKCVAISSRLVARGMRIYTITRLDSITAAQQHVDYLDDSPDVALLLDGQSLHFLQNNLIDFYRVILMLPVVIACRCSPQQKADLTLMVREMTGKRVCAIGDGGNDVSMIQAADVGVGIVGKEGRQASLAADFSIESFHYLTRLLLWHGRNSYKRAAKLAQFVIHRGLIISVCQAVYSIASHYEPLALYQGWLMVGYATVYTMVPVFSLVTDRDVDEGLARMYPELYKELTDGRSLSFRSFFVWVFVSLYQGIIIQCLSQFFIGLDQSLFKRMVMVSFTSLISNELLMVAIEIVTWNKIMFASEILTALSYVASVPFLPDYFDMSYFKNVNFYWQITVAIGAAIVPTYIAKTLNRRLKPPSYAKVQV